MQLSIFYDDCKRESLGLGDGGVGPARNTVQPDYQYRIRLSVSIAAELLINGYVCELLLTCASAFYCFTL